MSKEPTLGADNEGAANSTHGVAQQQLQRLDQLANSLPKDGAGSRVAELINEAKNANLGPQAIAKISASVADFEGVPVATGMVEAKSFDLASIPGLGNVRAMMGGSMKDMSGAGASDIHEAHISGPAARNVSEHIAARAEQQQAAANLPPLSA